MCTDDECSGKSHLLTDEDQCHPQEEPTITPTITQGSHTSWKVLACFCNISRSGRSWKMIVILESPGNLS